VNSDGNKNTTLGNKKTSVQC